jgi:hypothetical protein
VVEILAGGFWSDIERHHPGMTTLHLPEDVAQAWKQRMRTIRDADGAIRPRTMHLAILPRVRSLYLDIQEWALEDPSWAPWSVPSPVRRGETDGQRKVRKKGIAKVHLIGLPHPSEIPYVRGGMPADAPIVRGCGNVISFDAASSEQATTTGIAAAGAPGTQPIGACG